MMKLDVRAFFPADEPFHLDFFKKRQGVLHGIHIGKRFPARMGQGMVFPDGRALKHSLF
jgi:hypothetical protein